MDKKKRHTHHPDLCGKPDTGVNYPLEKARTDPPHCLCCKMALEVIPVTSQMMQSLGMYTVVCKKCTNENPPPSS
jgi:hypothetical protein